MTIILKTVVKIDTSKLCTFAIGGREAVEKVKASTELNGGRDCGFQLIFMDCNMPIVDGYEATR